jgi:hypothetical protein
VPLRALAAVLALLAPAAGLTAARPAGAAPTAVTVRLAEQHLGQPSPAFSCAVFASAILDQAGVPGPRDSSPGRLLADYPATRLPAQGDLIGLSLAPAVDGGQVDHIGFLVAALPGGRMLVVSGNDGGRVTERIWPAAQIAGFAHLPPPRAIARHAVRRRRPPARRRHHRRSR